MRYRTLNEALEVYSRPSLPLLPSQHRPAQQPRLAVHRRLTWLGLAALVSSIGRQVMRNR